MLARGAACLQEGGILYITLPKSCIDNSRYLNHSSFIDLTQALGLEEIDSYFSRKLVLFAYKKKRGISLSDLVKFTRKKIVNPGKKRNNFSITFNTTSVASCIK